MQRLLRAAVARRPLCAAAPLEYASTCFFPTSWAGVPLLSRREVSADSSVLEFGLPNGRSLDLPTCACVLLRAPGRGDDGADAVRPYTPISDSALSGRFELLVKRYDGGAASQYLHGLPLGSTVEFKHITFNIKEQYPFDGKRSITLVAAGTGITPMYQAMLKLLGTPGDERPIVLLYGSRTPDDILLKDEIDEMARAHPHRLTVVHVVGDKSDEPPPADWVTTDTYTAEAGWIDERKIAKYAFAPSADTLLFVCGLPPMYAALCGPRNERELAEGSVLHKLGYTADMVAKM